MDLTKIKNSEREKKLLEEYSKGNFSVIRDKYNDDGTQYCFDVLDKKIVTGYLLKLACYRHISDLRRVEEKVDNFPFIYDVKKCEQVLNFAAICPNVDTGKPVDLMGWQKFILSQMFGWRGINGNKRYSSVIVSVARAQGKTYLCAIIACYSYLIESMGKNNQDLMVTSNITEQAKKIFGYISTMMNQLTKDNRLFEEFAKKTDMDVQYNRVIQRNTNNRLLQLSAESGKFDSYHFLFAVYDEAGETNHSVVNTKITSGQINTENSQFVQISTAYPDSTVPFKQEEDVIIRAMEQDEKRAGDHQLCLIWSQDKEDEIDKPETWVKSNPLLDLPDKKEQLISGLQRELDVKRVNGEEFSFANKNLNIWLDHKTNSYIDGDDWDATTVSEFDISNRDVYIGFDASLTSDNTALFFIFPYEDGDQAMYHLVQHSFVPWKLLGSIEAKEKSDGIQYRKMADLGYCTITNNERGLINLDQVYTWLLTYIDEKNLNPVFFGYDALRTNNFTQTLNDKTDWNIMPVKQTSYVLTESIKFVQNGFYHRQVTHLDDEIMKKALMNAEVSDNKAGMEVGKSRQSLKIDVVDALIDAMYQAMYHFNDMRDRKDPLSSYSDDDILNYLNSDDFSF
ncbi:terminase large subunit [Companilactobacillus jidongensis]|uniref:terminase large subunit n=1 Tax=Companilactobacillus jidongensis TaxID=2486006 RepID=UPI000F7984A9|nr:terminase TerL endonuclease subunit [Companilactobacillus jidongensis]